MPLVTQQKRKNYDCPLPVRQIKPIKIINRHPYAMPVPEAQKKSGRDLAAATVYVRNRKELIECNKKLLFSYVQRVYS